MMKLETAPVRDNSSIAQIQAQLAVMDLELRDMKKGKTGREEFGAHNVGQKVTTRNNVLW